MKKILSVFFIFTCTFIASGQKLYIKTFGNPKDKPILFLHGGPGYNCVTFEATTAQKLADNGFYVIVYDRRGEGRSVDTNAKFTFKQTFDDINYILTKYKIGKVNFIGHSFGGIVATLFTEKYPEKVNSIILVSAPVVLQETFKTILKKSKEIYRKQKDDETLEYIEYVETLDSTSIDYSSYCFGYAMQNDFYSPNEMTDEAKKIYGRFRKDTLVEASSDMSDEAPEGFWKNEKYTTIDLTPDLKNLLSKKTKIFGLFGKDDGLYSTEQVADLQNLIGSTHLQYLDNCSHSVFIDRQTQFIQALKTWIE